MNGIVAALAVLAAFDLPQRVHQLRDVTPPQRLVVAAATVAATMLASVVATPLLDALDISAPNLQIGAGVVLAIFSLLAVVRWDDSPAPGAVAGGLVPLLFPIVLTPAVGVVVLAVAARNGVLVPVAVAVGGAAVLGWSGSERLVGRRPVRMLSATVGIVVGVALIVDGAFAV